MTSSCANCIVERYSRARPLIGRDRAGPRDQRVGQRARRATRPTPCAAARGGPRRRRGSARRARSATPARRTSSPGRLLDAGRGADRGAADVAGHVADGDLHALVGLVELSSRAKTARRSSSSTLHGEPLELLRSASPAGRARRRPLRSAGGAEVDLEPRDVVAAAGVAARARLRVGLAVDGEVRAARRAGLRRRALARRCSCRR